MTPRGWLLIGGAGLLLIALFLAVPSPPPEPEGPPASSLATAPDGVAAAAELLERNGRDVAAIRRPLDEVRLDAERDVVIVLDPPKPLDRNEARRLREFLEAGGSVVVSGSPAALRLDVLMDDPPVDGPGRPGTAIPVGPVPELAAVGEIRPIGSRVWTSPAAAMPAAATGDGPVVAIARVGDGRLVLLSDSAPLHNANLATADNAALVLGLVAPGRTARFAEHIHGFAARDGLAALPAAWKGALGGLAIAAGVWIWARARRLGPPRNEPDTEVPPRVGYVEALAVTLRRTGQPAASLAPVRRQARRILAQRTATPANTAEADLIAAAARSGIDASVAGPALSSPTDASGIVAAGRALARLEAGDTAGPHLEETT